MLGLELLEAVLELVVVEEVVRLEGGGLLEANGLAKYHCCKLLLAKDTPSSYHRDVKRKGRGDQRKRDTPRDCWCIVYHS